MILNFVEATFVDESPGSTILIVDSERNILCTVWTRNRGTGYEQCTFDQITDILPCSMCEVIYSHSC